jgi:nitrogen fixation protein FixH
MSPNIEEPIMNSSRLRPWTLAVGFGVVIASNGALAYLTQGSLIESVTGHAYDDQSRGRRALDATTEGNAPGWTGKLYFFDRGDESGRIVFDLADRAGKPLTDLTVKAHAARADEPSSDVLVLMHESAPGRYVGQVELDRAGPWEIKAGAQRADSHFEVSGQIAVK